LSAAGARWGSIEKQLQATPIVLSTTTSPVPSLRYVTDNKADYPNGVSFVPTRVASLLFYGGYCSIEAGDFPAAEQALRAAARVAPFDAGIHLELAHALVTQKKLADAASEAELGLRFASGKCQTGLAWRKKGFVLFEQGKLVDAYRAYQKSLEFDPASQIALSEMLLLAKTLTGSGGVPSDIKGFVPPPSQGSTTRCTDE
jgi:tetratricopeptide (TPR) repeat protein